MIDLHCNRSLITVRTFIAQSHAKAEECDREDSFLSLLAVSLRMHVGVCIVLLHCSSSESPMVIMSGVDNGALEGVPLS